MRIMKNKHNFVAFSFSFCAIIFLSACGDQNSGNSQARANLDGGIFGKWTSSKVQIDENYAITPTIYISTDKFTKSFICHQDGKTAESSVSSSFSYDQDEQVIEILENVEDEVNENGVDCPIALMIETIEVELVNDKLKTIWEGEETLWSRVE